MHQTFLCLGKGSAHHETRRDQTHSAQSQSCRPLDPTLLFVPQKFEASADAAKTVSQTTGALMPFTSDKHTLELVKITKDMKVGRGGRGGSEEGGQWGLWRWSRSQRS